MYLLAGTGVILEMCKLADWFVGVHKGLFVYDKVRTSEQVFTLPSNLAKMDLF